MIVVFDLMRLIKKELCPEQKASFDQPPPQEGPKQEEVYTSDLSPDVDSLFQNALFSPYDLHGYF